MQRLAIRTSLVPLLAFLFTGVLWLVCNQSVTSGQVIRLPSVLANDPSLVQTEQTDPKGLANIIFTKTVGTLPNICAATKMITVTAGTPLYYCYSVQNLGSITLTTHTIKDSLYENPLTDRVPYILKPGPPPDSVAIVLVTSNGVQQTTVSTGTWIAASDNGFTATASDRTTVVVPALLVQQTVGTDANACATTAQIAVPVGTRVTYCYTAYNTGQVTLRLHDIVDSQLGVIRDRLPLTLAPGKTIHITATAPATQTITHVVTWTSYVTDEDGVMAVATSSAQVRTPAIAVQATVGVNQAECATSKAITVTAGTAVDYCYSVTNTGGVTFTHHEISDDTPVGHLSRDLSLAPGYSYKIGVTAPITQSTVNQVAWIASDPNALSAKGTDQVTVTVVYTLGVFLYYDVDDNGVFNDLERGQPAVQLHLQQADGTLLTAATNTQGEATFTNVLAGVYTVTVDMNSLPPGFRLTTGNVPYVRKMRWGNSPAISIGYTAPPNYNSDCDTIPDRLEGSGDLDHDGIADYLEGKCVYLPILQR